MKHSNKQTKKLFEVFVLCVPKIEEPLFIFGEDLLYLEYIVNFMSKLEERKRLVNTPRCLAPLA